MKEREQKKKAIKVEKMLKTALSHNEFHREKWK